MDDELGQEERLEALEFAARAVSATLALMAQAGTIDHVSATVPVL